MIEFSEDVSGFDGKHLGGRQMISQKEMATKIQNVLDADLA